MLDLGLLRPSRRSYRMSPTMIVDRSLSLSPDQYYATERTKSLVCLHHTVGGSAKSTFKYWQGNDENVGTAFQVARGGTVFQHFAPHGYAYQYGLRASSRTRSLVSSEESRDFERRSIGIELSSEGALVERNDELYAFPWRPESSQKHLGNANELLTLGTVVHYPAGWRGWEWFDAYDPVQIDRTIALVNYLCGLYRIPRKAVPREVAFAVEPETRLYLSYKGVIHHAMVRPDKSDLHPGFPWERLFAEATI